ncbi:MAG: hypothetical protein PVJ52_03565 [Candidatus Woesebacteria bacterium]|jgi:hypothetical protein
MTPTARKRDFDTEKLRQKLKLKHLEAKKAFAEKYPHLKKVLEEKGIDVGKIRDQSAKVLGIGFLTGSLLISSPKSLSSLPSPTEIIEKVRSKDKKTKSADAKKIIIETFKSVLPDNPRPLTRNEEKLLEQVFKGVYGLKTKASLEGEHLNTTYGYIGYEQHLRRYPGDTLGNHSPAGVSGLEDKHVLSAGIAPGLGAWGYFAPYESELTQDLIETERWYAVVQTLYLPDWNSRQPHLKNWYKYRKVLIVNTENGKAVVAAIADSGPAAWTGKQFGGSPEVMNYLGGERYRKGKVIIFFVDDPDNEVPLGPVDIESTK